MNKWIFEGQKLGTAVLGLILVVSALTVAEAAEADGEGVVLIERNAQGDMVPGSAQKWREASKNSLVLTLKAEKDADAVALALSQKLPNARVSLEGREITIAGMPTEKIYAAIVSSPVAMADPLQDLHNLGGDRVVALGGPEAGGSIRAAKPSGKLMELIDQATDHSPEQRFEARVLAIERGVFPHAKVRLHITRIARQGALKKLLRVGKRIQADIAYVVVDGNVDLSQPVNQRNLVAYYLKRGDRIVFHAVGQKKNGIFIDWLERK